MVFSPKQVPSTNDATNFVFFLFVNLFIIRYATTITANSPNVPNISIRKNWVDICYTFPFFHYSSGAGSILCDGAVDCAALLALAAPSVAPIVCGLIPQFLCKNLSNAI